MRKESLEKNYGNTSKKAATDCCGRELHNEVMEKLSITKKNQTPKSKIKVRKEAEG